MKTRFKELFDNFVNGQKNNNKVMIKYENKLKIINWNTFRPGKR
jgi:hypothetical protein